MNSRELPASNDFCAIVRSFVEGINLRHRTRKPRSKSKKTKKKSVELVLRKSPLHLNQLIAMSSHGTDFHVGDIVSFLHFDADKFNYAQIRKLFRDKEGDERALITWMYSLKCVDSKNKVHPATFILGPEEKEPRRIEIFVEVVYCAQEVFVVQ
ncbi:GATA zinc finger domain-containing protein 1 [Parasteatoda tepidariorum]|nr:GATA zinc finger domain-containing protein 1 [Parasteatoda tepidariorum]